MKKIFMLLMTGLFSLSCFCETIDFSKVVGDFMLFRMKLSEVENSENKMTEIENYENNLFSSENEFDADQKIIMENYIAMEKYNALFSDKTKVKGIQKTLRNQKEKMEAYIAEKADEKMSKWFWCSYADTISCMMSFSVSDVMKYGLQVKEYYEKSLAADENYCYALMNLGQWYYWAPKIAGGGKAKADELFEKAFSQAKTPDEIYFCGIVYSQSLFEAKKTEESRTVLLKAKEQWPESKTIGEILSLNEKGLSIYQAGKIGQVE